MAYGDNIRRQAVIDAIEESRRLNHHKDGKAACAHEYEHRHFLKILRDLPSVQHIDADGTLWITVPDIKQVKRVIVDEEKSKFCRQFYMEEEQRTGHWIPVGIAEAVGGESAQWGSAIAYHKCSECDGQALGDDFELEVLSDFCPHCGARMEKWSND